MRGTDDITGMRFGEWTALYKTCGKHNPILWHCKCSCGKERDVNVYTLINGTSKTCGHFRINGNPKHGKRWTKLYMVWDSMKSRCNNPKNKDYHYYGGRGINVCDEWNKYPPFEKWALSHGYKEGLSIDRIDVDGNYCPQNCRWATAHEQRVNQRPRQSRRTKNDD